MNEFGRCPDCGNVSRPLGDEAHHAPGEHMCEVCSFTFIWDDDERECSCHVYVVDFSDPERFHPENLDREDDPNCPIHGAASALSAPKGEPNE